MDDDFEAFLEASARLTGFTRAELLGTGCAEDYWTTVRAKAPADAVAALLRGEDTPADPAVIELWYLGVWRGLMETDTHVVSPRAFREGLVWTVIDAHPMGAKQQGYGAWTLPPTPEA